SGVMSTRAASMPSIAVTDIQIALSRSIRTWSVTLCDCLPIDTLVRARPEKERESKLLISISAIFVRVASEPGMLGRVLVWRLLPAQASDTLAKTIINTLLHALAFFSLRSDFVNFICCTCT